MSKCQAQITHSFSLQSCWQWPCASRLLSVFSCLLHPSSSGWKTLLGWQSWKHWHRKMGIYFSWGVAPCLLRASRGWRWGQVAKTTLWDLFIVLPHVQLWDTEQRVEHGSTWLEMLSPASKSCWERSCSQCLHLLSLLCPREVEEALLPLAEVPMEHRERRGCRRKRGNCGCSWSHLAQTIPLGFLGFFQRYPPNYTACYNFSFAYTKIPLQTI